MNEVVKRDYIEEFRKAFSMGIENISKAAEIYVAAIEENKNNAAKFHEVFEDMIPAKSWGMLEAVGKKWMHPKLLMGTGGQNSGKIRRLPYSTQEQVFNGERFDLLTKTGDLLKVDLRECTPEQVEQLLNGSVVRTISHQKAWLESRVVSDKEQKAEPLPYSIHDGKVTFRRGVVMTKRELNRIISEL